MGGWKRLGLVFLAAGLSACGGSSSVTQPCPGGTTGTPPNCVATPPPCTQSTLYSSAETLPGRTLVYFDFSVPDTGRLDVTLDWTFPTSPVGFYLVPANTCDLEEFNDRSCDFKIRSEPSPVKPRKISQNLPAGNYRWLTGTFGEEDESASLQIVLSKGTSCPALTSTSVGASARDEEGLPSMQRARKR